METADVSALLVDVAARVVLPRWRRLASHEIFDKGHGDLVTVADREAERELGAALAAATPGALIVGEEAVAEGVTNLADLAGAGHAWLIDPVDGTGNFAHGSPDFAVMVAEVVGGATERAWIWQPVHERLYVAEGEAHLLRADGTAHAVGTDAQCKRFAGAFLDAADDADVTNLGDGVAVAAALMLEPLRCGLLSVGNERNRGEQRQDGENDLLHDASPCL